MIFFRPKARAHVCLHSHAMAFLHGLLFWFCFSASNVVFLMMVVWASQVSRDYSAATNSPRGFLRAPWNVNPSSYVTRYHSILGSDEVSESSAVQMCPICLSFLRALISLSRVAVYSINVLNLLSFLMALISRSHFSILLFELFVITASWLPSSHPSS